MDSRNKAFRSWRRRLGLTQENAAFVLDLGINTVFNYESGKRRANALEGHKAVEVPKIVLLACAAIEKQISPIE